MVEPTDVNGFPSLPSWELSTPLRFDADWQGKNADPERETEVRLLWTLESFFVRFHARFRTITVFPDAEVNGRRDQLWDRAHVLAGRLADKPPLAVQGTVKAVWDSLSMTIEAIRSVPLMYTQLINPKSKTAFDPGVERNWEIR